MCSAYKLNKQGNSIQPWRTPFPIWNQSVAPCPVLTVASWPAYRFLKRQVRWYGIPTSFRIFQFIVILTVKGFGICGQASPKTDMELQGTQRSKNEAGGPTIPGTAFRTVQCWHTNQCTAQSRNKPQRLWSVNLPQRRPDNPGGRISTNSSRTTASPLAKNKVGHAISHHTQNVSQNGSQTKI